MSSVGVNYIKEMYFNKVNHVFSAFKKQEI